MTAGKTDSAVISSSGLPLSQGSPGFQSRDRAELSMGGHSFSLSKHAPRGQEEQHGVMEIMFVCTALATTLIIFICLRFRVWRVRGRRRGVREDQYEDAASTLDPRCLAQEAEAPPPHNHSSHPSQENEAEEDDDDNDDRGLRFLTAPHSPHPRRSYHLHQYEEAKPILDLPRTPRARVHQHQYEEAIVIRQPAPPAAAVAGSGRGRGRRDSADYAVPYDTVPAPAAASGASCQYQRLGDEQLKRTLSEPAGRRHAYNHVILTSARAKSAGKGTSASGKRAGHGVTEGVTLPDHVYDVSNVATAARDAARVEVIDGIYDKLAKSQV